MRKHTFVILACQESDDLEECIKSVLKQSVKSNVIIATSTPNDYIMDLASEYSLGVIVNEEPSNKESDYNFAINTYDSPLITIAHQDDLYARNYTKEILKKYKEHPDATILFTDNYEIKNDNKIIKSKRLRYKRFHLLPLKYRIFEKSKFFKLRALRKEKFICTSSITFVKENIQEKIFPVEMEYHNDWQGLINLARSDTKFVFIDQKLVGYRLGKKDILKEEKFEQREILKSLYPKWYYEKFVLKRLNKEDLKENLPFENKKGYNEEEER